MSKVVYGSAAALPGTPPLEATEQVDTVTSSDPDANPRTAQALQTAQKATEGVESDLRSGNGITGHELQG